MRGQDMFSPIGDMPLGNPDVVEELVRQFILEVVDIRKAYHEDKIEGPAATIAVAKAAARYAAIFMGGDPQYSHTEWNTPERLGAFLLDTLPPGEIGATTANACELFFHRIAADLLREAIVPSEQEKITEDALRFRLDVIVEDARYALLGLYNNPEGDENSDAE
ncbi:hypothetical protein UFOVP119_70 [uncultured Caudovirales phage]|uniref:Uncharacterized protein n=1 Tax=uncultured Caudovirales phage TaxID=2100421 RepID=A0A6J5LB30_9CAUD|nr:hypothetical protein UFOVP119_70 [uncultured Caudovirales phage]